MIQEVKRKNQVKTNYPLAVLLMVFSALCVAFGQYSWKIAHGKIGLTILGFVIYAIGALLMLIALKFGEVSKIQPLQSLALIFGLIIAVIFLKEHLNFFNYLGTGLIILGIIAMFVNLEGKHGR